MREKIKEEAENREKYIHYLGDKFARNWAKPKALSEAEYSALKHAYMTGFKKCDDESNAKISKLEQELDKIKTQNEFLIQYYNPKSLAFKNMIDTFIDLPKDKQQKLIDLAAVLKGLET